MHCSNRLNFLDPRRLAASLLPAAAAASLLFGLTGCQSPGGNSRLLQVEQRTDTKTARRHYEKGLRLLDQDKPEPAEAAFDKAVAADERFGPAYNNLGCLYFEREEYYRAAWAFEKAAAAMPQAALPLNNLGLIMEEAGRLNDAIDYYQQAHENRPEQLDVRANLARSKHHRGDRDTQLIKLVKHLAVHTQDPQWREWATARVNESVDWER